MKWTLSPSFLSLLCALGVLCGECPAEPPAPATATPPARPGIDNPKFPTREISEEEAAKERARLEQAVLAAFERDDFAAAEAGLRELIPLDHDNFVPWYNLACALSMQGKTDEALEMLRQAIARGFADLREMQRDPHLAGIRATDEYKAIVAAWSGVLEKRTQRTIDAAAKKFRVGEPGSPYVLEKDEGLRLVYISAFDRVLFEEARADAVKLERWWRVVAGGTGDTNAPSAGAGEQREHGSKGQLPASRAAPSTLTPWVLVILPTRADFIKWAIERHGDRFDRVGGEYNHSSKMLVSMDLGSSWRHEFWHILHWRDMDARGQRHPMWVMEGLCSLVEDCDTGPGGEMIARPSWRTNMILRLGKSGRLIPWEVMFSSKQRGFMNERPLAYYGQARAMFLFLAEQGKLAEWYSAYTAGWKEEPTGKGAFEAVLGKPIKQIERDFRVWVNRLPEVADEVGRGPANLPVDVGIGGGDGPVVRIDAMADFLQPGGKAPSTGGLRNNDVITAIDGKPVRDLNDLARVLGGYEAGAMVSVSYIRGKAHGETTVRLVPPR